MEYKSLNKPQWASLKTNITKFSRNFHILDWTGLFKHTTVGLVISGADKNKIYSHINIIANMDHDFLGFEDCYGNLNPENNIQTVVSDLKWGEYFDAFSMPIQTLKLLSDSILDEQDNSISDIPFNNFVIPSETFPELSEFQSNQIHAFVPTGDVANPFEIIIKREKANREHARILNMIAATMRASGNDVFENIFIDLLAVIKTQYYIFEVKSNNTKNVLSQIRKALAQLYEYRYRSKYTNAILCIILQEKPTQNWIIDYLINDREIMIGWLVDDVRIECPPQCYSILHPTGIV